MYVEGEMPVAYGNGGYGNNGFGNGWEGLIGLALVAALFGGGWGGGFGFGGGRGGSEDLGWQLGRLATTNDVASGFSTSTILGTQRDVQLGQTQGFADIQQTLCQGFGGINQALERGFSTTNYNMQQCCCDVKSTLLENRYLNEKQTCELINNQNSNTQRIIDYLTGEKIDTLNRKLATAENALTQCQNNAYLLGQIKPQPVPAYPVFPTTSFAYPSGVTFGVNGNNGCCNCNGF